MAISQFHVKRLQEVCQMRQEADDTMEAETEIGAIFLPQLHLMCDAYKAYIEGMPSALALLDDLMTHADFTHFLQISEPEEGELDILDFIKKPALVRTPKTYWHKTDTKYLVQD